MPRIGPFAAQTPGKFNVYSPQQPQQYTAYDTLAEAQADVQANQTGVILNPGGQLDPSVQTWSGWSTYQANFPAAPVQLNPGAMPGAAQPAAGNSAGPIPVSGSSSTPAAPPPSATAVPTAGQYSVWVPPYQASQLRPPINGLPFTNGAYFAFGTAAQAQAEVNRLGFGLILDPLGKPDATQPWNQAAAHVLVQTNTFLTPARPANQVSVWFPVQVARTLGMGMGNNSSFPSGAYLAFNSTAEAHAHVQARSLGIVLDANGGFAPNQQWANAAQYGAQLLNARLSPAPTANQVSVWFPAQYATSLGVADPSPFTTNGAYLSFSSVQEATTHAMARGFGVLLDAQGNYDTTNPQPWNQANRYGMQLLNPKLSTSQTANTHAVWIPQQYLNGLGLPNAGAFTQGAYLAFNSAQEAQAHVQLRTYGVVLDPNGAPTTTQSWNGAGPFLAQLSNSKLTATATATKFNVWFPTAMVTSLGLSGSNGNPFPGGAYLAFDSLAAAQAHVQARTFGAILDPQGAFDPNVQKWNQAGQYAALLLNAQLQAQPTPNKFNVWFPGQVTSNLGVADSRPYSTSGAYLAFNSAAEAAAHVQARNLGIVLTPRGDFDTSVAQPWNFAGYHGLALLTPKLAATRPANQASVWIPNQHLANLNLSNTTAFPNGAYLPFDSAPAAIALTQTMGVGAVLDANGELEPQQGANASTQLLSQQRNAQLQPMRTPGKVNVWFPKDHAVALGVSDATPYTSAGAYLAFDSLKAAQAHVSARGFGVVLDAQGHFDLASQTWPSAGLHGARMLNAQLVATQPTNRPYVWFPNQYVATLGVADATVYSNGGAYLPFATMKEATDHAKARGMGLLFDTGGKYDPSNQVWAQAAQFAPLVAVWPPPPVGPEGQTPIQGSADIVGVYAKAATGGARISVRTHNVNPNEALKYELYLNINGSEMKVKDLGTSQMGSGFMHDAAFDISYAELNTILSALQPGSTVTPGTTAFSIRVQWPSGHDQGANGAGGRGAHRFPAP